MAEGERDERAISSLSPSAIEPILETYHQKRILYIGYKEARTFHFLCWHGIGCMLLRNKKIKEERREKTVLRKLRVLRVSCI
jgi:hypothetical protein